MRWIIVLRCEDGAGNLSTTDVQTLERAVGPAFSMLLAVPRGKRLLLRLQQQFVRQQAAAYCAHIRPCRKCGINRSIKDYRPQDTANTVRQRRGPDSAVPPVRLRARSLGSLASLPWLGKKI